MAANISAGLLVRELLRRHHGHGVSKWNTKRLKLPFMAVQCLLSRDYQSAGSAESASVSYRHGFMVLSVPLPSRNELCEFTLRPVSHSVKDLVTFITNEDGGIDRAAVYNMDDVKISNSTPVEVLMKQDFKLLINEKTYDVVPPKEDHLTEGGDEQLSQLKNLVQQLYIELNVREYQEERASTIMKRLEHCKSEIEPLENAKKELSEKANKRTSFMIWGGMAFMAVQFGFLARLTWWEYSWDIMEPVTYFVTYGTSMAMYAYFVLTKQEYIYPDARNRQYLINFHKESSKTKFDLVKYNALRDAIGKLEEELKLLNSPQYRLPAPQETASS